MKVLLNEAKRPVIYTGFRKQGPNRDLNPGPRASEARMIATTPSGPMIYVESEAGFVPSSASAPKVTSKRRFQPRNPGRRRVNTST
ncbi:hypothetical protein INT45_000271 [Circinella minor]|uniref:Uncharacterized protein n=1 Tax=Circinella minor TaxID=1195481 RepID=A0A8H7VMD1_9FUNG|nr:hypothetical protein INT45_000271 [Circinella minor]